MIVNNSNLKGVSVENNEAPMDLPLQRMYCPLSQTAKWQQEKVGSLC